MNSTGR